MTKRIVVGVVVAVLAMFVYSVWSTYKLSRECDDAIRALATEDPDAVQRSRDVRLQNSLDEHASRLKDRVARACGR